MAKFDPFRTLLGAVLVVGALPGLIYGAVMMYPEHHSEAVLSISGLLLAYGAGLVPLVVGMLLWETALLGKSSWLALLGASAALPPGAVWLRRTIELFRIADKAWLPSAFLVAGLLTIAVWSGTLLIRARRRREATD